MNALELTTFHYFVYYSIFLVIAVVCQVLYYNAKCGAPFGKRTGTYFGYLGLVFLATTLLGFNFYIVYEIGDLWV